MSKRFARSGRGRQCGCRCRSQGEPRRKSRSPSAGGGEKRWAVGTESAGCRTPRTQTRIARWCCRRAGAEPTGREPRSARTAVAGPCYASRDRAGAHPERHLHGFCGILQADAYSGYNRLYDAGRPQGAITPALCWAHARRQFFELADIATNPRRGKNAVVISPIALEAVRRIDALFEIERVINGRSTASVSRCAESRAPA